MFKYIYLFRKELENFWTNLFMYFFTVTNLTTKIYIWFAVGGLC